MKLKFPNAKQGLVDGPSGFKVPDALEIEFAHVTGNRYQATVPVSFSTQLTAASADAPVQTTLPITVEANASTAKGGAVRAVVRVSIPYQGLIPLGKQEEGGNLRLDPARSGKEVALHVVLSMPREMAQDFRNHSGSAGALVASEHITLLSSLLNRLLGSALADRARSDSNIGGTQTGDYASVRELVEYHGNYIARLSQQTDVPVSGTSLQLQPAPVVEASHTGRLGDMLADGLRVGFTGGTEVGSNKVLINDLMRPDQPFYRAALGLPPLDGAGTYDGLHVGVHKYESGE